ncbi:MAG: PASTA domain-containing protein, partial [Vallitaleaceae bacterium]|nr:PASTA domain-containing protein [Vallitaleaceae bacterium]
MSEKPNFLDDIQKGKPESFKEEVFTARKRNFTPFYVGIGAVLIVVFVIYLLVNRGVEVPDMSGWKEGEVYNWGKENGVTIVKEGVYDLTHDTGILIEQGTAANGKLKKSNPLNVKISLGPDPNEALELIDIKASSEEEIKAWVAENKLTGISIRYEASQVIPQGTVINFEIVDGTASSFLRKNRVNVFVSSGPEVVSDTVTVPDFYKATKGTVVQWATKNGIEVVYTEAFDEFIELGAIRSQSIKADTKITRNDVLEVELSLGVAIVVPDFNGMTKTAAADLATRSSITLYYEQAESAGDPDKVLSQDVIAGSSIAKNQPITLTISKESEYKEVPNFVGLSQSEATSLAALHNIKLFFVTVDSTQNSEKVISQDLKKGDFVSSSSYVTLKISSGKLIVPNFIGLTKTEAETMAEAGGFNLTFDTDATVDGSQYTILTQSRPAESLIDKTTGIRLTTGVKIP